MSTSSTSSTDITNTNTTNTLHTNQSLQSPDPILDNVQFGPQVHTALATIAPSSDPLDSVDFNPLEYINSAFPTGTLHIVLLWLM